jgi:hypothetical protein
MNGKPILNKFLNITGTFELIMGATIQFPPIILIHLKLHMIPYISHFTTTWEVLIEYYHNENQLCIINLPFNISNNKVVGKWNKQVDKLMEKLSGHTHVVIFATTHLIPNLWLLLSYLTSGCIKECRV